MIKPTQIQYTRYDLLKIFSYDKKGGRLLWRESRKGRKRASRIAGHIKKGRYRYTKICLDGKGYSLHRLIYYIETGSQPWEIDHIDGNPLNNCFSNLQTITRSQNMMKQMKYVNNTSGRAGITFHEQRQKWRARIQIGKKRISLGLYSDIKDAINARTAAEDDCFGKYIPVDR